MSVPYRTLAEQFVESQEEDIWHVRRLHYWPDAEKIVVTFVDGSQAEISALGYNNFFVHLVEEKEQ